MTAVAGLQLAKGYFDAQNAKDSAELNQDIAEMNAEFAELDAYDAEVDGFTQIARYQGDVDKTLSQQRLNITAADVDINYGSAASIVEESRFVAELNKMEIEKQAQEKALGYRQQARSIRITGSAQNAAAKQRSSDDQFRSITGAISTGASGYSRSKS